MTETLSPPPYSAETLAAAEERTRAGNSYPSDDDGEDDE